MGVSVSKQMRKIMNLIPRVLENFSYFGTPKISPSNDCKRSVRGSCREVHSKPGRKHRRVFGAELQICLAELAERAELPAQLRFLKRLPAQLFLKVTQLSSAQLRFFRGAPSKKFSQLRTAKFFQSSVQLSYFFKIWNSDLELSVCSYCKTRE